MASASNVRVRIKAAAVPIMHGVLELITAGVVPSGTKENAADHARFSTFADTVDPARRLLFSDSQTSGGLLIAVPPANVERLQDELRETGALSAIIGLVEAGQDITVE